MSHNYYLSLFLSLVINSACSQTGQEIVNSEEKNKLNEIDKVVKSNEEWKKELDPETYYITREKGTERAFTGRYYKFDKDGIYHCSNCGNPLFKSEHKYESGSGWPSFYSVYNENSVKEIRDDSHGMIRTEVVCQRCDAHLGHIFEDGPKPTGLRYCVNSPSLKFENKSKEIEKE